jgi:hypothetical protein
MGLFRTRAPDRLLVSANMRRWHQNVPSFEFARYAEMLGQTGSVRSRPTKKACQIRQTTDRRALHIAQVVQMAMNGETGGFLQNLSKRELVSA